MIWTERPYLADMTTTDKYPTSRDDHLGADTEERETELSSRLPILAFTS